MSRKWNSAAELAAALRARADEKRNTVLSPDTARLIALLLEAPRQHRDRPWVDVHAQGSAIYKLDAKGDIEEVVAFASNSIVARAAFNELCASYPRYSFSQRRRSWVEEERIVGEDGSP